jgi:hypothetical protein
VRLNGTSDILWEREADHAEFTVFDNFPDVQFYDYTKLPKRLLTRLPPNYHLTLSYSGANEAYARKVEQVADTANASVVYVLRTKHAKAEALRICGESGVDGDSHDLRFLDPPGSRVFLSAKGAAKHDRSGFVLDGWQRP